MYKNRNRGYQQLHVWADAIELYRLTCSAVRCFPYELKRVASQQIASADSVHRNIAEGYCRRSLKEYLQHLYIALGSTGELVSGLMGFRAAGQMAENDFLDLDALAFKLENGLLRLVESLERKQEKGDWVDQLIVREANTVYGVSRVRLSGGPSLQDSAAPTLQPIGETVL